MLQVDDREFVYRVNERDQLMFVNDSWCQFARENGAPALDRSHIINHSLWDYIHDLETEEIYRALLEKVRTTRQSVRVPFRCDAPDRRRFMQMQMQPEEGRHVTFKVRIVRMEERPAIQWEDDSLPDGGLVKACSWCKRIELPGNRWVELEDALATLPIFTGSGVPRFSHGMCDDCTRVMEEKLAEL